MMNRLPVGVTLVVGGLICLSTAAQARQFIGFGSPGVPGSLAFENYPTLNPNSAGTNTASNFAELAYFSKTGFTGTTRDQFEYWVGANIGYTDPKGNPNSSGWGMSSPEIGIEYYYNVIQPKVPVGSPGYFTFWNGPEAWVNFPNGNTQSTGYGAGADQYSLAISDISYIRVGNWDFTIDPVEVNYDFTNLNSSPVAGSSSQFFKARYGLSLTFGDVGIGYQFTPDLVVGILQQFNANNIANSNYAPSQEGFIGPGFTYAGFRNIGLIFGGTIQTDYYRENTAHNTYFALWVTKIF
jgi:hypothetical protein